MKINIFILYVLILLSHGLNDQTIECSNLILNLKLLNYTVGQKAV